MQYCMYLRKSRADVEAEARGEGETLARHEKILLEVAKRDSLNVTQIYKEIVSGESIAARPVVQRLLQEVEDGKWTGVLVVEVERLARGDTIDQGIVAEAFKQSGTRIITPLKVYDPNNEYDEEYFEFGLFMSRREYKTINRRLQRGRAESAKEGKWLTNAPYGYERVPLPNEKGWTLAPVEPQASIVKMIFRLYVSGETASDGSIRRFGTYLIAARLSAMGIPPPRSIGKWHYLTIRHILRNTAYIGIVHWNVIRTRKRRIGNTLKKERYLAPSSEWIKAPGRHPPLVDEETFRAAQEILGRKGPAPLPGKYPLQNALAGLVVCKLCGGRLLRQATRSGAMLLCRTDGCPCVGSKVDVIEDRLLRALSEWLAGYRLMWKDGVPPDDKRLVELKEKAVKDARAGVTKLRKQLARAYDMLEQGVYDINVFLERSRELTERIAAAEVSLAAQNTDLQKSREFLANHTALIPKVEHILEVYASLPDASSKNELLKEVVEKAVYCKRLRTSSARRPDDFELVVYPKIPKMPGSKK